MSKGALEVWTREVREMRGKGMLNEKLENTEKNNFSEGTNQKALAEKDSIVNTYRDQQNLFNIQNISESSPFPPGRSREKFSFGLDEAVSFKLRLFKQEFEKEKKIALEWNDVIEELLNRADKNK
jgi:hypothetical protein